MTTITKNDLRRTLLRKRRSLTADLRQEFSDRILRHLLSLDLFCNAKSMLLFCPFDNEPDITPAFDYVLKEGKSLVLPKVEGDHLLLLKTERLEDLRVGAFCIREPVGGEKVEPEDLDLAVVPGVAFDRRGYRLGMGKGYYDRLLVRVKAPKVGVAYSFQVLERIPVDPWDQKVDLVITEEGILPTGGVNHD